MKILVAMDSFKGSASSLEVGRACARGLHKAAPDCEVIVKGLADGGEGTLDVLAESLQAKIATLQVHDAYGHLVDARYGICEATKTIIIEIASIVGLPMHEQREPLNAGTYGLGELLKNCLDQGYRRFVIGVGGSATNDAGMGMMCALGARFYNAEGQKLQGLAKDLYQIVKVDLSHIHPGLKESEILLACDVNNPLCGSQGATAIYGPQKGVTTDLIESLDQAIEAFAKRVDPSHMQDAGAGAAGGLGYAFMSLSNCKMKPGIDIVMETGNYAGLISKADLVISGEGQIDAQTAMGKGPGGLAKLAQAYHKPMILIGGSVKEEAKVTHTLGIGAIFSIQMHPISLEEALDPKITQKQMELVSEEVMRLFLLKEHMALSYRMYKNIPFRDKL